MFEVESGLLDTHLEQRLNTLLNICLRNTSSFSGFIVLYLIDKAPEHSGGRSLLVLCPPVENRESFVEFEHLISISSGYRGHI